jgi:endonuclease III
MAKSNQRAIARAVLARYPKSYAEELRIDVARNTPAQLYQWLIASLLFSARIGAGQAKSAAQALLDKGWRTPKKMAEVTWAERVKVLNRSGYARYDESTSRYIADTTGLLLEHYGGDLRKLREAACRDPERERQLLKQFKGIGDVGADIFCREAQIAWDELYPFSDRKALDAARGLSLPASAGGLARLVDRRDLPRLLAGLVRVGLAGEADEIREQAA